VGAANAQEILLSFLSDLYVNISLRFSIANFSGHMERKANCIASPCIFLQSSVIGLYFSQLVSARKPLFNKLLVICTQAVEERWPALRRLPSLFFNIKNYASVFYKNKKKNQ
jgi:hypothetical protein